MPLVAPPSLNDPLDARVTDDHALFSVIQDGNDARVIVGCLAQPRPSTPVAYHVGFKSVVLWGASLHPRDLRPSGQAGTATISSTRRAEMPRQQHLGPDLARWPRRGSGRAARQSSRQRGS